MTVLHTEGPDFILCSFLFLVNTPLTRLLPCSALAFLIVSLFPSHLQVVPPHLLPIRPCLTRILLAYAASSPLARPAIVPWHFLPLLPVTTSGFLSPSLSS